jgi:hypothetical protein
MSEEYSDDFSRGSEEIMDKKHENIDSHIKYEDEKEVEQSINRITNDTKRLKKPKYYGKDDTDPNSFISTNAFTFHEPDHTTHWKTIDKVDLSSIIAGDIQQLNTVTNELAFSNFNDPYLVSPTSEGRKALQILQFSLQYFMFTQSEMASRINTLHSYIKNGKEQLEKIKTVEKIQKEKIKKQKRNDRKLNEQAMHFEFLIRKFRPDLDPEKLQHLHEELNL